MGSKERTVGGEGELKRIREQLFQIKLLLVAIFLTLLLPIIGPGLIVQLLFIGILGLAAIYAGLRTFESLVKRKVGQNWSDEQFASLLDKADSPDADDSAQHR